MAELEAVAARDSVPIVHWETGRFLAVLCRALDPVVLEVGTAIGYSTLHTAQQLSSGRILSSARPGARRAGARLPGARRRGRPGRAGRGRRARDDPGALGPFGLLFVDASKGEYTRYIELMEPLLAERCVLVVDNPLMEREVALPEGAGTQWDPDSLNTARVLNSNLLGSERWLACVLPIGDGIGFGARRD